MRVLLLAMPDVASCFDRVMRLPNLGIASIAANIDGAEVHTLDLVLHPRGVGKTVKKHLENLRPDIVGLSAMTFQYDTAKTVAGIIRQVLPNTKIVLGGYHATLAADHIAIDPGSHVFDYLIRGEGEVPMNQLHKALRDGGDAKEIAGLSYRVDGQFVHNPIGSLTDLNDINIPERRKRLSSGFTYFGKRYESVETSRGCLKSCRFCSIRGMYGRSYRTYPIERVISDISDAKSAGAEGIFFTDDNINLVPGRLMELCSAIVDAKLNDLEYITQADVAGFVAEPELPNAMQQAGFKGVFLGIESTASENWQFLRKRNLPDDTHKVVRSLRNCGISVAGGFIVGNPEEDENAVRAAFHTALSLPIDHAIMWCLTPYPGTEARESMQSEGLVESAYDFKHYNGYMCHVRTKHLSNSELIRLIAKEGAKLYFNPRFFLRSHAWPVSAKNAWIYFRTVSEYITHASRNRLFASRHKI
ncbi:MAG: radical SAM protein [Armatimonadota bacterium]